MSESADRDPAARFAAAWDEFVLAIRRTQARGQPDERESSERLLRHLAELINRL